MFLYLYIYKIILFQILLKFCFVLENKNELELLSLDLMFMKTLTVTINVVAFRLALNIDLYIAEIMQLSGNYRRSTDVCRKFYLKIDQMKYRSSMERCPVGGLTMMTSFLAALTMTSSFGPKSRTSTG